MTALTDSELGYTGGLRLGWKAGVVPALPQAPGLVLLGARVYHPELKRWLVPDTVDPLRYTYTGGDPVNFIDPSGRMMLEIGKSEGQRKTISNWDDFSLHGSGSASFDWSWYRRNGGSIWYEKLSLNPIWAIRAEAVRQATVDALQMANAINSTPVTEVIMVARMSILSTGGHSWIWIGRSNGEGNTWGTWGNNPPNPESPGELGPNGVRKDIELGFESWSGAASRSRDVSQLELDAALARIADFQGRGEDAWRLLAPCSAFAADVWNAGTGEALDHARFGLYSTPVALRESIIEANGGSLNAPAKSTFVGGSNTSTGLRVLDSSVTPLYFFLMRPANAGRQLQVQP